MYTRNTVVLYDSSGHFTHGIILWKYAEFFRVRFFFFLMFTSFAVTLFAKKRVHRARSYAKRPHTRSPQQTALRGARVPRRLHKSTRARRSPRQQCSEPFENAIFQKVFPEFFSSSTSTPPTAAITKLFRKDSIWLCHAAPQYSINLWTHPRLW